MNRIIQYIVGLGYFLLSLFAVAICCFWFDRGFRSVRARGDSSNLVPSGPIPVIPANTFIATFAGRSPLVPLLVETRIALAVVPCESSIPASHGKDLVQIRVQTRVASPKGQTGD